MSKLFNGFCQQSIRLVGNVHSNMERELLTLDNKLQ